MSLSPIRVATMELKRSEGERETPLLQVMIKSGERHWHFPASQAIKHRAQDEGVYEALLAR